MSDRAETPGRRLVTAAAREQALADRLERLYRRHHAGVYRLALRYGLGDEAWAEDVTQDVFIILLDALPTLDEHEHLEGWLYRVTTNRCLRKLRRERFFDRPLVRWLLGAFVGGETSIEPQVLARQDLERTRLALAALPARERVVLSMVHLDGKSQREVCETLGLSKGYVSKLLARAIARLEEARDGRA